MTIPPNGLAELQQAFAESIMTPLRIHGDGYSYQVEKYPQTATATMVPNHLFTGTERLSIYNQQYWFRLLSLMQREMPLTRHRLGIVEFNRMASDFLTEYPSEHPELHYLWKHLDRFMAGNHRWNGASTAEAAHLDRIYADLFFAMDHQEFDGSALSDEQASALLTRPLPFQSAWALFDEHWGSVEQRLLIVDDEDDEIALPVARKRGHWVIYRHAIAGITQEPLTALQYTLLQGLHAGGTLASVCGTLEQSADPEDLQTLAVGIQSWFKRWSELGWFRAI